MEGDETATYCWQCDETTVQVIMDDEGTVAECSVCYAENEL